MSVDTRARRQDPTADVGPAVFLTEVLPGLLDGAADRLGPWLADNEPGPLTILVDDADPVTLAVEDGAVRLRAGRPVDGAVLHLDAMELAELVTDRVTPIGWFASGTLRLEHGRLGELMDWWLVLRAALDGTRPHRTGDIDLTGADGRPLDLTRAFGPDDDPAEMGAFLRAAGYLHLTGVFSGAEMDRISADMDRAALGYTPGDGRSWWATLHDDTEALVRMQHFECESAAAAALIADDRVTSLGNLTGDGHLAPTGVEALFKPLGVARGISDIPWHKDCSLGGHSDRCSGLTLGVSVTGADEVSGQLKVVAGSHRALVWPAPELQPGLDLPVVPLATAKGDVTVHLSCTLHMAQPPTEYPRRVLYTSLALPPLEGHDSGQVAARVRVIREIAPTTVSQPASTVRS